MEENNKKIVKIHIPRQKQKTVLIRVDNNASSGRN